LLAAHENAKSPAEVVVANPPFGKKSSVTVVNEEGATDRQTLTYNRPDFWTTTSNKQLNFVQHVKSLLTVHGRAAVVVPDNVLFEGGEIMRGERQPSRVFAAAEPAPAGIAPPSILLVRYVHG
jgi:type I restriction enzyme M protein